MPYMPPFNKVKSLVKISNDNGKLMVSASYDEFLQMISAVLSVIEVDEAWYLERYPDVVEGIKRGTVTSARDHFLHNGYFEGRHPFAITIDEPWYLAQNEEVAEHVQSGQLTSAQQHFDHDGYREGRLPFSLLPP